MTEKSFDTPIVETELDPVAAFKAKGGQVKQAPTDEYKILQVQEMRGRGLKQVLILRDSNGELTGASITREKLRHIENDMIGNTYSMRLSTNHDMNATQSVMYEGQRISVRKVFESFISKTPVAEQSSEMPQSDISP